MDKGKWRSLSLRGAAKKLGRGAAFAARVVFGAACCVFCVYALIGLAKSGSPVFYYALAAASPGTVIEMWNAERDTDEPSPALSTENSGDEHGAQNDAESEIPAGGDESTSTAEVPEVALANRGTVTETQYKAAAGGIYIPFGSALIKNCTSYSAEKITSVLSGDLELDLSTGPENSPKVLIYHTHATEAFEPADRGYFDVNGSWRSTDLSENMCAVGDELARVLTENGIGVIHDYTLHDDPSYKGSYQRSAVTVRNYLNEYPTISVCIDLHRDAIEPSATEIIKPTAVINGKKAAQIMIISGCDDGSMNMPDFFKNLRFAAALNDKMESLYPGLTRPVLFDYRKYNMDLSPGLLLIEIGSTGNTLEEAKYSAQLLGNALSALFAE